MSADFVVTTERLLLRLVRGQELPEVLLAVAVGCGLYYLERRTRLGAIIRVGVDDRETIAALGIDINGVFTGSAAPAGRGGTPASPFQ